MITKDRIDNILQANDKLSMEANYTIGNLVAMNNSMLVMILEILKEQVPEGK